MDSFFSFNFLSRETEGSLILFGQLRIRMKGTDLLVYDCFFFTFLTYERSSCLRVFKSL